METLVIPPRSQHVVRARCEAPRDQDFLFEPARKLEEQKYVSVGAALVRTQKAEVPVSFLNGNSFPVVVYKGTRLGTVQPWKPAEPRVCMIEKARKNRPRKRQILTVKAREIRLGDPLETLDLSKSRLTPEEAVQFKTFLREFEDLFAVDNNDLGCMTGTTHAINTGDATPVHQRPFRTPMSQRKIVDEEIQKMQTAGVTRPSNSPWSSPVVLVPKPDGTVRFCVDFRALNAVTKKDTWPLPLISEILDSLNNAKYFMSMDLMAGYWQVPMAPEDIEKTAVVTHNAKWEFTRMPFGLCNAPATFQ
ncbi:MAG: RNA-directed DNA polymerase [Gammaproteobacteria bacterium]|nr:RNA-directed DNA polymerase [Gammaproteobacteria bacterium]